MTAWIGVTLGDVTGICPEVALKAIAAEAASDDTRYLLIGDENYAHRLNEKTQLPLKKFSGCDNAGKIFIANPLAESLPENLPAGSSVADVAEVDAPVTDTEVAVDEPAIEEPSAEGENSAAEQDSEAQETEQSEEQPGARVG